MGIRLRTGDRIKGRGFGWEPVGTSSMSMGLQARSEPEGTVKRTRVPISTGVEGGEPREEVGRGVGSGVGRASGSRRTGEEKVTSMGSARGVAVGERGQGLGKGPEGAC